MYFTNQGVYSHSFSWKYLPSSLRQSCQMFGHYGPWTSFLANLNKFSRLNGWLPLPKFSSCISPCKMLICRVRSTSLLFLFTTFCKSIRYCIVWMDTQSLSFVNYLPDYQRTSKVQTANGVSWLITSERRWVMITVVLQASFLCQDTNTFSMI